MANTLEIDVVLKLAELQKEVKALKDGMKEQGEAAGSTMAKSFSSSLTKTLGALGLGALLKKSISKAIGEAVEDERALTSLNQALFSSGLYSRQASAGLQALSEELARTTGTQASTTLSAAALGATFVKSSDQLKALTKAAVDFGAGRGIELNQAIQMLGATTTGTAGKLAKVVPELRNLTEEQLKAGAAIDIVAKKYAGFGEALSNTFEGALKKNTNSLAEVFSGFGQFITRSPAILAVINTLTKGLNYMADTINTQLASSGDVFRSMVLGLLDIGKVLAGYVLPVFEVTLNVVQQFVARLGQLAAFAVDALSGNFSAALTTLKETIAETPDVLSTPFSNAIEQGIANMKTAVVSASPKLREMGQQMGDQIAAGLEESTLRSSFTFQSLIDQFRLTKDQVLQMSNQLASTMKNTLTSGFTNAFASIGGALVKGQNAFAAFGKAILGMFGDLAIQLGQFYLLLGIGNLFLNPAASSGQIAAGIGLTVLGGALKALAGGGGSSAAGGSSASASSGGSAAAPLGADSGAGAQGRAPAQTHVAVNIQGNVLDRRETGLAVVEAIQEAFQTDGVVLPRAVLT